MSMLARYKKAGGILELVKLIEESAEPKKSQLLNMIRTEDADFALRVESRIITYETLKTLPENLVAEIVSLTPPKFVALALATETDAVFVTLCEKCLGKNFNEYKAEKETLVGAPPSAGQVEAGRRKLLAELRKGEAEGRIKLANSESESSSSGGTRLNAGEAGDPSGSATAAGGCPDVESFKMETPPPGLSGERFENYLKTQLGS